MTSYASPLVTSSMSNAATFLYRGAVGLCALYLSLRPLSPGLDIAEPEGAFLAGVSFLAALLAVLALLARREWILPEPRFWGGLSILIVCTAFSINTAATDGNYQLAADLGNLWLSDLFLLLALCATARHPGAMRLYLGCFAAGVVVACTYAVYQRFFGLEYLRRISTFQGETSLNEQFSLRLQSDRVGGPFSYANALAAICLLALPFLCGLARATQQDKTKPMTNAGINHARLITKLALLLALLALVYSGSKAGIAVALLTTFIELICQLAPERKTLRNALSIGGWLGLFLGIALVLAAGIFGVAGQTSAVSIFAILWWIIMLKLPGWLSILPFRYGLAIAVGGLFVTTAASVTLCVAPSASAPGRVRAEIIKQGNVRLNYWRAGMRMVSDHPLDGVGLDNFGERYPQYKLPGGWEVRRAHNHYLQLAADGGLPLLLAFLLFWGLYFTGFKKSGQAKEESAEERPPLDLDSHFYRRCGITTAVAAFLLTYYFCLSGTFTGLGIEFFLGELAGASGSIRTQSGSLNALWLHGGVHLILLPLVWCFVFNAVWKILDANAETIEHNSMRRWLLLGLAAVLLHAFFDFTLYHTAVAGLLWTVCALARMTRNTPAAQRIMLPLLPARLLMLTVLTTGLLLFAFSLSPRLNGSAAATTVQKQMLAPQTPEGVQEMIELVERALLFRPSDPELHRLRARLLQDPNHLRSLQRPMAREKISAEILREYERAAQLAPYSAGTQLEFAQVAAGLAAGNATPAKWDSLELMRQAAALYPSKALYQAMLALALYSAGRMEEGQQTAREALRLHELATDNPLRLPANVLPRLRLLAAP